MRVKAVPHEIAQPSEAGIYPRAVPVASAVVASALAAKAAASHSHLAADLPSTVQRLFSGTGSPEGVVTATKGALYQRTDGGAGTCLYVKESNTTNTGWAAK